MNIDSLSKYSIFLIWDHHRNKLFEIDLTILVRVYPFEHEQKFDFSHPDFHSLHRLSKLGRRNESVSVFVEVAESFSHLVDETAPDRVLLHDGDELGELDGAALVQVGVIDNFFELPVVKKKGKQQVRY